MKTRWIILRTAGMLAAALLAAIRPAAAQSPPAATTGLAAATSPRNATLTGLVTPNGSDSWAWFEWGLTTNYSSRTSMTNVGNSSSPVQVALPIAGLTAQSIYHCRMVASNAFGIATGNDQAFPFPSPVVVTEPLSDISYNSAEFSGRVCPNGWALTVWFEWGRGGLTNTAGATTLAGGNATFPLRTSVGGLVAGLNYSYRLVASNAECMIQGAIQDFVVPYLPAVTTLAPSSVTSFGGTLHGSVNPRLWPTTAWFEWGPTTNYGYVTSSVEFGASNQVLSVAASLSSLFSSTDYHFRLVATNAGGVVYGGDMSFTTPDGLDTPTGVYVTPKRLWPIETLVTAKYVGGRFFSTTPSALRIQITREGYRFGDIQPLSATPTNLVFKVPALTPGFHGFALQVTNPMGGWLDRYVSPPELFMVTTNLSEPSVAGYGYQAYPRGAATLPQSPGNFLGTMPSGTAIGAITGNYTNSGVVNNGESWGDYKWTKDFWVSGENGLKVKFDFVVQDNGVFSFQCPFEVAAELPSTVYRGQDVYFTPTAFRFTDADFLYVRHTADYSFDHQLWLNVPYDGLSPLDIFLSQQPDRLIFRGSLPVFPGINLPIDADIGGDFDDGDATFSGVHNRLGGHFALNNNLNRVLASPLEPTFRQVWTDQGFVSGLSDLWYSGGDQIYFLQAVPGAQDVAIPLHALGVELNQTFYINLLCTDFIQMKVPNLEFNVHIPTNAPSTYNIVTNLSFPVQIDLISLYTYQLCGGLSFVMPGIDETEIFSVPLGNIYAQTIGTSITNVQGEFTLNATVTTIPRTNWILGYAPQLPPSSDVDVMNFTPAEGNAARARMGRLAFPAPRPPLLVSFPASGTLVEKAEPRMALALPTGPFLGGTIQVTPPPVDGGYSNGTLVTLTAQPASGFQFVGWSGDAMGSSNTITVTMDKARNITPIFRSPTLNPFDGSSSVGSWSTWPTWGHQFPLVWDSSETTENPAITGSLRYNVPFTGAADDQLMSFGTFANRWRWDDGITNDGTQFASFSFDIKVAPGTAPSIFGNYGDFEVGLLHKGPTDWDRIPLPGFTLPLTNDWVHVVSPIDPSAPGVDSIVGMYIKLWSGGKFTNTFSFNVDNLLLAPRPTYEAAVLGDKPLAYYRLNEHAGTIAVDCWGGHEGSYQAGALKGFASLRAPTEDGFEAWNSAVQITAGTSNSWVTAPFGNLGTNTVTFTAWVYPLGRQSNWAGILMSRGDGAGGGLGYNDKQMLAYTWNNGTTWNYESGLTIPTNQWSLVAMVIEPTQATLHLCNANRHLATTNDIPHSPDVFGNQWRIGDDAAAAGRTFNGLIDEVAVFAHALTPAQIQQLYTAGIPPVQLNLQRVGSEFELSWPRGTLQEAGAVTGPYSDVSYAVSPHKVSPTAGQKFYRLKVR